MAVSRRKLLASAAALGALSVSDRVFAPPSRRTSRCASASSRRAPALPQRPASTASAPRSGRSSGSMRKGGIAGRKIELVIEEETSPKDTIERFSKLVQQEKVDCVQGIISTGVGLALGPVVEEARALTIFWDGTTQDGVEEKMPNPRYLFRSTDNECEAVMSSLLAIKHWKGKFARRRHQSRLFLRPQQHGGVRRPAEALQHRARGRHRAVAQGRHHGPHQPRRGAQGRQARPHLLLAAVRRSAGVHEAGACRRADRRAPSWCSRPPAGSTR